MCRNISNGTLRYAQGDGVLREVPVGGALSSSNEILRYAQNDGTKKCAGGSSYARKREGLSGLFEPDAGGALAGE